MILILWSIVGVVEVVVGAIVFTCGVSCLAEMLIDLPYVNVFFAVIGPVLAAGGIKLITL